MISGFLFEINKRFIEYKGTRFYIPNEELQCQCRGEGEGGGGGGGGKKMPVSR